MDGDRDARSDADDRFRGTRRIHVPSTQARAPAPYREKRDIHMAGEVGHLGKEVGVASEIHTGRTDDVEAERFARRSERSAPAVMNRRHRHDPDRADRDLLASCDLDDLVMSFYEAAKPRGDHGSRPPA